MRKLKKCGYCGRFMTKRQILFCCADHANKANAASNSLSKMGSRNPMFGRQAPNYKGGTLGRWSGSRNKVYKLIHVGGRQVPEHRVLMERHLGRKLLPGEVVHHCNGDSLDNRLRNLRVMGHGEHTRLHLQERRDSRSRLGKDFINE